MTVQELRKKTDEQLKEVLSELRETVRDMRFQLVTRQLKDVKSLKKAKKNISRVLTIMKERELNEQSSDSEK